MLTELSAVIWSVDKASKACEVKPRMLLLVKAAI